MAPVQRTRSRERLALSGSHTWFGVTTPRTVRKRYETMTDYWKKKKDPLGLFESTALDHKIRLIHRACYISGTSFGGESVYSGCPATALRTYALDVSPTSHNIKDRGNTQYLNELLSQTNPGRPVVSIPVAIKELAEVSTLFGLTAKSLAGFAGGAYLNYRFGWKAFERDLRTFAKICEQIESRLKELDSLNKAGGLRRTVKIDDYITRVPYSNWTVNSTYSTTIRLNGVEQFRTRVYGSVRWFPAPGAHQVLENRTPLEHFKRVVRDIFDLGELDASTAWQLIPFSWLADYFIDVSSYLDAATGSALYHPDYACIIRKSVYTSRGRVVSKPDWVRVTGHHQVTYRTQRTPVNAGQPALPLGLSIITMSQAKVVLALLAKLRDGKRYSAPW